MLIHASRRRDTATRIPGDAHIVIGLDVQSGAVVLRSYFDGELDSSYAPIPPERLPVEVAKLLAELRAQLSVSGS